MSSLKKNYSFKTNRTIWRIIPAESNLLVIEERDTNSREVFFNVLTLDEGKIILNGFQLEEKYWVGIESVYKDIIFFHKFKKPDLPGHRGIYAFDIQKKKIIWQNDDLLFSFVKDEMVYAYQQTFDGRKYFIIKVFTGEVIREFENDFSDLNRLREDAAMSNFANTFLFPQSYKGEFDNSNFENLINHLTSEFKVEGTVNWLSKEDLVMFNYHEQNSHGTFNNYFKVYNSDKSKYILKETLNAKSKNLVPDSFFVIGNLLFLLIEKNRLVVYEIMQ